MAEALTYVREAIRYRTFWFALAGVDLRNRFRRTALGVLWAIVQPLAFTLLLSVVFHFLFNQSFTEYSVYVFSGLILWNWFSEAVMLGANSLVNSHSFIRQRRLPLIVYALRTSTLIAITYLLSFAGFFVWFLATGNIPGAPMLLLLVNIPLLAACMLPLTVISGVLGAFYRDFHQLSQIGLQGLWFMSPVFIDRSVFARPELRVWDEINPVSRMLDLMRAPLLYNQMPAFSSYVVTITFALAMTVLAALLLYRHERSLVHYV